MIKKTRKIFIAFVFILSVFSIITLNSPINADEGCSAKIIDGKIQENILIDEPYRDGAEPTSVKF